MVGTPKKTLIITVTDRSMQLAVTMLQVFNRQQISVAQQNLLMNLISMLCGCKGVQSDAHKVAEFRAMLRMRRSMLSESTDPKMRNFTRMLIKVCYFIIFLMASGVSARKIEGVILVVLQMLPRYQSTHGVQMSRFT